MATPLMVPQNRCVSWQQPLRALAVLTATQNQLTYLASALQDQADIPREAPAPRDWLALASEFFEDAKRIQMAKARLLGLRASNVSARENFSSSEAFADLVFEALTGVCLRLERLSLGLLELKGPKSSNPEKLDRSVLRQVATLCGHLPQELWQCAKKTPDWRSLEESLGFVAQWAYYLEWTVERSAG